MIQPLAGTYASGHLNLEVSLKMSALKVASSHLNMAIYGHSRYCLISRPSVEILHLRQPLCSSRMTMGGEVSHQNMPLMAVRSYTQATESDLKPMM